ISFLRRLAPATIVYVERAVIVDAVRTPIGRYGGALQDHRPDDLAALVIRAVVDRNHLDPQSIEDVFFGDANQAGEDNRNVARMADGQPTHARRAHPEPGPDRRGGGPAGRNHT